MAGKQALRLLKKFSDYFYKITNMNEVIRP